MCPAGLPRVRVPAVLPKSARTNSYEEKSWQKYEKLTNIRTHVVRVYTYLPDSTGVVHGSLRTYTQIVVFLSPE